MLQRVARALLSLEMLAEGVTARGFDARVTVHGGERDDDPRRSAVLEQWCAKAEAAVAGERRREAQAPETVEQFRYRLIDEGEGLHYRDLAARERVSPSYVRKIRHELGREPTRGRPENTPARR
jgi:hypothetical protein